MSKDNYFSFVNPELEAILLSKLQSSRDGPLSPFNEGIYVGALKDNSCIISQALNMGGPRAESVQQAIECQIPHQGRQDGSLRSIPCQRLSCGDSLKFDWYRSKAEIVQIPSDHIKG